MTDDGDCLTPRDLADRWKVSIRTLERRRAVPSGPAWITIGGSIRYRMTDVLAWEAAHLTRP
ncbi:hypothetical protein SAMN04488003_12927 [Loktanella fryxellensis]|uniref:Helix-turn-helix domain-containing protein n=1 Tax=Loktanella fryxellensis TaxID=245187 RepID=A0A1H8IWB7_9RHOB|nr:hypothetical protein SAMN04488003_12927 [Loktanella fryxellensis]